MSNYDGNERILLVVGLGNPGAEYEGTRHNAGFMVIDRLLAGFPAGRFEARHVAQSFVHDGMFRGTPLFLQKPQTFMNLSGLAVAGFARKEGIRPEEILVVSDDLDLPVGRLRLRTGGSDGGHNGLKSVIAELGSALSLDAAAEAVRAALAGGMSRAMNKFNAWAPPAEDEEKTNQSQ